MTPTELKRLVMAATTNGCTVRLKPDGEIEIIPPAPSAGPKQPPPATSARGLDFVDFTR